MYRFYIVKNKRLRKLKIPVRDARLIKRLDLLKADLILEKAIDYSETNMLYICYSNFSNDSSREVAFKVAKEFRAQGINAQVQTQNVVTLVLPEAASLRILGSLDRANFYNFEAMLAASAVRAISV